MCFFDSPIGRCEVVRELVLLDETQQECAGEHGCPPGFDCPLKGMFADESGVSDPASLPCRAAARARAVAMPAPRARARPRSEELVLA